MKRSPHPRSYASVLLAMLAAAPALAQSEGQPPPSAAPAAEKTTEAAESSEGADTSRAESGAAKDAAKAIADVERSLGIDLRTDRHYAGGYRAMGEDYYAKKITKEELKKRIALVEANREERRKEHLHGLKLRWGALLADPGCREELAFHARREARLSRALFLAHTEAPPEVGAKLIPRIETLIDKEEDRHAAAMEQVRATPASPPPETSTPGNANPDEAKAATP